MARREMKKAKLSGHSFAQNNDTKSPAECKGFVRGLSNFSLTVKREHLQ